MPVTQSPRYAGRQIKVHLVTLEKFSHKEEQLGVVRGQASLSISVGDRKHPHRKQKDLRKQGATHLPV